MSALEVESDSKTDGTQVDVVPHAEGERAVVTKLYGGVCKIPLWKFYILLCGQILLYMCNSGSLQSMNVAIGFVAKDLLFESSQVQWIQAGYSLSSGCLLLFWVSICDKYGARNVVWATGGCFVAFTAACAAAQTPNQLIAFRTLQGAAICALVPAGWDIITQLLPSVHGSKFRSAVLAIYASGAPLGSACGTLIGGLATQYSAIQWRGIYVVYACLAFAGVALAQPFCPPSETNKDRVIDYTGTAIISTSLTFIFFVLAQGSAVGWGTGYIIALLVVGCALIPVFVLYEMWLERQGKPPMMRMSMFSKGRFAAFQFFGFFGFACFVTWDYWSGLFYTDVQGQDAVNVMLRYLPQAIGGFAGVPAAAYLSRKLPINFIFVAGCLFTTIGNIIFAVSKPEQTYWESGQFFGFFLNILGATWLFNSACQYSVAVVPPAEAKIAGGLFQIMTSLATSWGTIVSTIVAERHAVASSPMSEYTYAWWTCAAFGAFAVVGGLPLTWGAGIIGESGETARVHQEQAELDNEKYDNGN